jgi:hypothetical protein
MEPPRTELNHQQAIQLTAYHLWQQRGCPFGSPEVDWFEAEERLVTHSNDTPDKSAIVAVGEAVGSVLGSIAGIVGSLRGLVDSEEESKQP